MHPVAATVELILLWAALTALVDALVDELRRVFGDDDDGVEM